MRLTDKRTTLTLRLYLRLCSILAPCFLLASAIGLYFLTEYIVDNAEGRLSARIGNAAARVAGGLERVSEDDVHHNGQPVFVAEELTQILMADPAIVCVEILDSYADKIIAQVPRGVTCREEPYDAELVLAVYFPEEVDLIVRSSVREIDEIRETQQLLSALILFAGLMIALVTNWITFRVIIGRPLRALIEEIDDARNKAEITALHDSLTGLGNRRYLHDVINKRLSLFGKRQDPFAVLHLDLDHFKQINDAYGHSTGDAVLRHVAGILKDEVGRQDFVARVGGDEFVIVTYCEAREKHLSDLANRLIRRIDEPLIYHDKICAIGTSIGIYSVDRACPPGQPDVEYVLNNSDFALYRAKEQGRGNFVFFDENVRVEIEAEKFNEDDLRRGIEDGEIICFYQPQFDVPAGRVLSVEALARWDHPLIGVLAPNQFLPLADKLGLTARVDELVLQRALQDLARWDEMGLGIQSVSVNISGGRLEDPGLLKKLAAMNLPRGRLTFEVLETSFVDKLSDVVRWNLDGMRELGIEIELDDFGTGKASVLGIIEMAPHRIKVAREIIAPIAEGDQGMDFVRAIAAIGHSLNVAMIAEGVEEEMHCRAAAELGFSRLQGYHISRPISAAAFEEWMQSEAHNALAGRLRAA